MGAYHLHLKVKHNSAMSPDNGTFVLNHSLNTGNPLTYGYSTNSEDQDVISTHPGTHFNGMRLLKHAVSPSFFKTRTKEEQIPCLKVQSVFVRKNNTSTSGADLI